MNTKPVISVVLGSFNRKSFLKLTIESVRKEIELCAFQIEIIVVDGGSSDGSIEWLTKQKDIITIIQHNNGIWNDKKIERKSWGFFMNLGFKSAHGKYICMISDDCLIVPGAIKNGYDLFEKKLNDGEKVGCMAFYWRNWPDEKKYFIGLTLGKIIFPNHGLYLREALEQVNFIDEDSYYFYYGDSDLALKIHKKGYLCIESQDSYIEHFSHAFNSKNKISKSRNDSSDFENLKNKWENDFNFKNDNYFGGWIEKDFYDKTETIKKFNYLKFVIESKDKFSIYRVINKIKNLTKGK